MALSEREVREKLSCEEPEYAQLASQLEAHDVPILRAIAEGDDVALATKAIYLASLLEIDAAHQIVVEAAESPEELKRIAAGSGVANLPSSIAHKAALRLLEAPSPALAKLVLRAVRQPSSELKSRIQGIAAQDRLPEELRALARAKAAEN